jgi:AcrR family transcriptional regulator
MPSPDTENRKRMTNSQRRQQMLETAIGMAREHGALSLTLANVAKESGVSKPVAYHHFGTLEQLLGEIYGLLGSEEEGALITALDRAREARAGFDVMSSTFSQCLIDCTTENGQIHAAISAILSVAGASIWPVRQSLIERYAGMLVKYLEVEPAASIAMTVNLLGAAEALAESIHHGLLEKHEAVSELNWLIQSQAARHSVP